MVKMNYKDPVLEKIARSWQLSRNTTLLFLEVAIKQNILDFSIKTNPGNPFTFQSVLFQFQCLATTTDTYFRKLIGHPNKSYGILVVDGKTINKKDITLELIKTHLKNQIDIIDNILKPMDQKGLDKHVRALTNLSNHEYLHLGQLLLMFRQAGIEVPERFKHAWAL